MKILKYIMPLLCFATADLKAQVSNDRNFVSKSDIKQPGVTTQSAVDALTVSGRIQQVGYFDGLGRPIQQVLVQGSPTSKDVIMPVEYDNYGREIKKFLPYTDQNSGASGSLRTTGYADQRTFYSTSNTSVNVARDNYPFLQTHYQFSPSGQTLENGAPGETWQPGSGHTVKPLSLLNTTTDDVKKWTVTDVSNSFGTYATSSSYSAGELFKNVTSDEHGKQVIEFKDKEGKVILKKVQLTATPDNINGNSYSNWLCTYYLYDDFNHLRCVIQPKAVESFPTYGWSLSTDQLNELCFRYEYDSRGRMIMKKVPGAAEVYMVYDARDRLVMTQDGNLRSAGKWMVTMYDILNRLLKTGLLTDATTSFTTHLSNASVSITYPSTASNFEVLTETGYDDYSNIPSGSPSSFIDNTNITSTNFYTSYTSAPYAVAVTQSFIIKGLPTWSKIKIIGTSSDYLYGLNIYDEKGRVIQVKSTNISGGTDVMTTQYDFTGKVLRTYIAHQKSGTNAQTHGVLTKMTYDNMGKLLTVSKTINSTINSTSVSLAEKTIVTNDYDELGQLKNNKLGVNPSNSSLPLETMTYDYNIRGWTLGANRDYAKTSSNSNNYFGYDLGYDQTISTYASAQYNGNIGGTVWKTKGDNEIRKYDFSYDAVNRITGADFNQYTSGSFSKSAGVDFSVSNLIYDANGNISAMNQKGLKLTSSSYIDQLSYSYQSSSNKLQAVTDASNDNSSKLGDFKYDASSKTSTDYSYDVNGNLTADANKKISSITYNHLNLPSLITVTGKGTIGYTYDAAGNKLKKVTTEGSTETTTLYMFGNYINDVLQFLPHEEGRIRYKPGTNTLVYDYFLKDHLGNVRMVLTDDVQQDIYPAATLEGTTSSGALPVEQNYYDINTAQITDNSLITNVTTYPNNNGISNPNPQGNSTANSSKMYKLSSSSQKMGLGITLKVMAGDKLDIFGKSYFYGTASSTTSLPVNDILTSLFNTSTVTNSGKGIVLTDLTNNTQLTTGISGLLGNQAAGTSTDPKAYINYMILDDHFNYVTGGFSRTGTSGTVKDHYSQLQNIAVTKNGYVYIYCSNESNLNVYFDNLQVVHTKGPILEETHYYPFGLPMAGISSISAGGIESKSKFNGKEIQNKEFNDGSGLEMYDFKFRFYDMQIGRFFNLDRLADKFAYMTPYQFCSNNPIWFREIDGLEGIKYTQVDKNGNKTTVVEKNVVILTENKKAIPTGASQKQIDKITKQNSRIEQRNNDRIESAKSELNTFYNGSDGKGASDSKGNAVQFKFNVKGSPDFDKKGMSQKEIDNKYFQIAKNFGMDGTYSVNGVLQTARINAAVMTNEGSRADLGNTDGGTVMRMNFGGPEGTFSHEVSHTLGLADNGYTSGGILNSPPEKISSSEVDKILQIAYDKK